ncbi:DUF6070 family protein [Lachnospiraceae bacterium ZAX-1]
MLCFLLFLCFFEKKGELQSDDIAETNLDDSIRNKENESLEQMEKGYNLPVIDSEREEAETDCIRMMEVISDIYMCADKGEVSNVSLSDKTMQSMQDEIKKTKEAIRTKVIYSNMENYESVDVFLNNCLGGISGSVIVYEIHFDGSIGRMKFVFDGTNMYVLNVCAMWNKKAKPDIIYATYTRIKEWSYTDKGWFCYEVCVPEPPEVSEIVDGSCLIRVKPMTGEQREMSEKCVLEVGYQGNNLLCSNWDMEHMEGLDYTGMYEYLYRMKYEQQFKYDDYLQGIPKDDFENLIMEYLPITAEQIREYAVFDEKYQTYEWTRLGCLNYAPTFFGTSMPEVTDIIENEDGTVTLTVDAVCEMILCDDAVITHELTIRFKDDGSFQYCGNKILNNGIEYIPRYQYRIDKQP